MKTKDYRIGNRIAGLGMATLGGAITLARKDLGIEDIAGTIFMIEGLGDLISGRHLYLVTNALRYFSKGKIDIRYGGDSKYMEAQN